ncbi:DsbA family oxidoreductase [Kribbella sp. NPDC051770]|uniref:DsbA family oxidoreductase n=1 Tax=Kribbella sp. NPDC051770 TaxID=3155413 RepID=UPI00342F29A7
MKIEFWSDVVCPYCGLMDNRLQVALARFPHAVEVVHRSIQLHPDLPRTGVTQRELLRMHGVPGVEQQVLEPIEAAAHAEGLTPYRAVDRTLGPTDYAHELLAYASSLGRGNEVWTAIYRAHFGEAREFWTLEQVLEFADELGLDGADEVLRSRRYQAQVAADQREAERLGAQGAPFVVIDNKYAIPGAVGVEQLLEVMERAWADTHPVLEVVGGVDGACGPDSCAV